MDTKNIFVILVVWIGISSFWGCGKCEGDEFGIRMKLIVPINTFPAQDTFFIGDTLWIEANIDKYVEVENHTGKIFLEGFNFFTTLIISEISDATENFAPEIEIIEQIGQVEILNLPTAMVYPLFYVESDPFYNFKAGVVFNEIGRYYLSFDTEPDLYKNYEHPAMYRCESVRRLSVEVSYTNTSTSQEAYSDVFLDTDVDYLIELMDFSRYSSIGAHTFIVRE